MQCTLCRKRTDAIILQCVLLKYLYLDNEVLQEVSVYKISVHMACPVVPRHSMDGNYGVLYFYVIEFLFLLLLLVF